MDKQKDEWLIPTFRLFFTNRKIKGQHWKSLASDKFIEISISATTPNLALNARQSTSFLYLLN